MKKLRRSLYLDRIRPFIDTEIIKVLLGMRYSGKTTLLEFLREDLLKKGVSANCIRSFNFEEPQNFRLCSAAALNDEIKKFASLANGKVYLFFDEIDYVADWELSVSSMFSSLNCEIFIASSNANLLSGKLATHLAGRYVSFTVYPFSYAEFVEVNKALSPHESCEALFKRYLFWGGLPHILPLKGDCETTHQAIDGALDSLILRDFVARKSIRQVKALEEVIAYIASKVGTSISANSIQKALFSEGIALSTDTVLSFIAAAKEASLLNSIPTMDLKRKAIFKAKEKFYLTDMGFRKVLLGSTAGDIELILENIVYMELIRQGFKVYVGRNRAKEIDFVAEKANKRLYVQVAYLLASDETIDREFGAYAKIDDNYPKYVLSMDAIDFSRNGIIHRNICDALLDPVWG